MLNSYLLLVLNNSDLEFVVNFTTQLERELCVLSIDTEIEVQSVLRLNELLAVRNRFVCK